MFPDAFIVFQIVVALTSGVGLPVLVLTILSDIWEKYNREH